MTVMGPPTGMDADRIRLAAFREKHPEWRIRSDSEWGVWHAERETDHGSDTHIRHQLSDLMDYLEGHYP